MSAGESSGVYRVTIRGRFADLTEQARRYLHNNQAEHDIFVSAYTPEGSFTYDSRIDFFNMRYEVRAGGDAPADRAVTDTLGEAEVFLQTMGFGYRDLKPTVVDMTAMWADVERRRA